MSEFSCHKIKIEIEILTGVYAGHIVEASEGRVTPMNPDQGQFDKMVEGVQIPSLGNFEIEKYNYELQVFNYENLHTAYDINHNRINIGDRVIYCIGGYPECGVVEKFGPIRYADYYTSRTLKIRNSLSKRLETIYNPLKCIIGHIVFTP